MLDPLRVQVIFVRVVVQLCYIVCIELLHYG